MAKKRSCAYCGAFGVKLTRDHVFPRGLFPDPPVTGVQRLTVPACHECNNSYADDEAHFRNVIAVAGEASSPVTSLWEKKISRSLNERDGRRRAWELMNISERVDIEGKQHLRIFPARDQRVLRVIRKCIRGLSFLEDPHRVPNESRIWVDILRYSLPDGFEADLNMRGAERHIVEYGVLRDPVDGLESVWLFRFFSRTPFIASVSQHDVHSALQSESAQKVG